MKKILLWGGGAVLLIVVIGAIAGGGKPSSNTETVPNQEKNITSEAEPTEQPRVEKMTISNSTANSKGYGVFEVIGEITNNDSVKHSATLKATFYDRENKILGTAVGAVNDVEAGQTKTFNLMTTDSVDGYSEFKVQIDTLL